MLHSLFLSFFLCFSCLGKGSLEEGIQSFQEKKYDKALQIFSNNNLNKERPIGSLIGSLFCQIALGQFDGIDTTMDLINQKIKECDRLNPALKKPPQTSAEQQAAYVCRRKIREISNEMRQTVERLVRENVQGPFQKIKVLRQLYPFIDSLERVGIDCCESSTAWGCCLSPLVEQLEAWNILGIQMNPHLP